MKSRYPRLLQFVCLIPGVVLTTGLTLAHHPPEEAIAELTLRIERGDDVANNYFARATEYRILGRHAEATADYRAALALLPGMAGAHRELARLYAALGVAALGEAEVEARSAVATAKPGRSRAVSWIVLAEILDESGHPAEAVNACEAALEEHPAGDVDWFLLRSCCQAQMNQSAERIRDLEKAQTLVEAGVLRVEWIEALLDAGDWSRALPEIESELAGVRLRSSWLIRRARVFVATDREDEAQQDLLEAQAEIDSRLHPRRPDPGLIADRGVVCAMLGDSGAARTELDRLSNLHGDAAFRRRIEKALSDMEKVNPGRDRSSPPASALPGAGRGRQGRDSGRA